MVPMSTEFHALMQLSCTNPMAEKDSQCKIHAYRRHEIGRGSHPELGELGLCRDFRKAPNSVYSPAKVSSRACWTLDPQSLQAAALVAKQRQIEALSFVTLNW